MDKRQLFIELAHFLKDKEEITDEDMVIFFRSMLSDGAKQDDLHEVYAEYMNDVDALESIISFTGKNGKEEIISSELTSLHYDPSIGNIERKNLRLSRLDDGYVGELVKKECDNGHKLSVNSELLRCAKESCKKILCSNCDTKITNGEIYCKEHTLINKLKKSLWEL